MKINSLGVRRLQSACLILVALLFTQCDKDDNYVYPDVLTDFMDIYTNEEAMVDCIHPDASGMLSLQNLLSGQGLRSDTLYRAVGMYALPDADGSTLAYSVSLVYAEPPIRMGEGMTARMDSLYVESVYRGGGYLNIVVQPMMQTKAHVYAFVEDSVVRRGGRTSVYFTLAHSQNDDRESFPRRVYLSIPLKKIYFLLIFHYLLLLMIQHLQLSHSLKLKYLSLIDPYIFFPLYPRNMIFRRTKQR